MKTKRKTINIDPYNVELVGAPGDWRMEFLSDGLRIKIKIESWWAPYYVRELRKMLDKERAKIDREIAGMEAAAVEVQS